MISRRPNANQKRGQRFPPPSVATGVVKKKKNNFNRAHLHIAPLFIKTIIKLAELRYAPTSVLNPFARHCLNS